jgi:D-glycero-D-manno-heptose 1,7-bisphosphate phosphatase
VSQGPGVFLDRDGVLNAATVVDGLPRPPADVAEVRILPGVEAACRELAAAGLVLIGITNQPDIARGTQTPERVAAINAHLKARLGLDDLLVCPHDDADGCDCRKPRPGMIIEAAQRWDIDLAHSVTVGDRWRDVEAGRAAGTRTVFIDRHYAELAPSEPDLVVNELEESIQWIIRTAGLTR